MQMVYDIAVLLTCFNRKKKTINALNTLFKAIDYYKVQSSNELVVSVFLTDDGCSDGTSQEVIKQFAGEKIEIIKADGNAYWAGGMRLAWEEAMKTHHDYFLLVNDDTSFKKECIEELFSTNEYALRHYNIAGVYTGFVCSAEDESIITYGAKKYTKQFFSKAEDLRPTGAPQDCLMTNGNVLMVASNVVDAIGILDKEFIHAAADMDYGIRAHRCGFPVLTTPGLCGYCENDHDNSDQEREKVLRMSLKERKAFLDRPNIKQYHDSLVFYKRYDKFRFCIFKASYILNLYLPRLYYCLYKRRNH